MKKILLMLFTVLMAVTNVGWMQAADTKPEIFTDLDAAVTGKPIVFNVGTAKGTSKATNVRVKISLTDSKACRTKCSGTEVFPRWQMEYLAC